MSESQDFLRVVTKSYSPQGPSIILGCGQNDNILNQNAIIKIPLATLNRHGLIAGATGTGKTKTLQLFSEQLSLQQVPVFLMDLKGDLSGLAAPAIISEKLEKRNKKLGLNFTAQDFPVEFLSLTGKNGVALRATVSEFGPLLLSKILDLNETQSGVMSILFAYCDDEQLPLLDLADLKKVLTYAGQEGQDKISEEYGHISSQSIGAIMRKVVELERQGGENFFGEPSFDIHDLMLSKNNKGVISLLSLKELQSQPKLFSSFMLCLLAEVYNTLPEVGDLDKPKLVMIIDEAHLLFKEASKALLAQLDNVIKLIRSKGVGVFFCTQNPDDIPEEILGQLGLKVQHALRAFTAKDRKAIKLAAQNYPESEFYKIDELITSLGVGEAAITALDEDGRPTPVISTMLRSPQSLMGPITADKMQEIIHHSSLVQKYAETIDRNSAYEILSKKIKSANHNAKKESKSKAESQKKDESLIESITDNTMVRQLGRTVARELTRAILGVLGMKKR